MGHNVRKTASVRITLHALLSMASATVLPVLLGSTVANFAPMVYQALTAANSATAHSGGHAILSRGPVSKYNCCFVR